MATMKVEEEELSRPAVTDSNGYGCVTTEKIEDVVTNEIREAILKNYNSNVELVDFDVEQGTVAGDNYMSIMYSVKMNLRNRQSGESFMLPVMLKVLPKNEFRVKMIREGNIFVKDVNMYGKIIPDMIQFQIDSGLTDQEIIRPWAKCYAFKTDGESDFLAMEDLKASNFKMANRKEGLDFDHCQLLLKTMAQFHAISYAMFHGDFEEILNKYSWLAECMFRVETMPEAFKEITKHTLNQQAAILRESGEELGASLVEKIYSDSYFHDMFQLVGGKAKWAVIGHGDCWTNNFLFRYDSVTSKPIEVKFVDFQVTRASSRAVDIHYFLYSSPQTHVLNEKEEELEQIYFDEFILFTKKLGIDVDEHKLNIENFKNEIEKYRYYGVVAGMMLALVTSADTADVPEMESIKEEDLESEEKGKNFFLNMMKDRAIEKVKNIAGVHLPKCTEMKKYLK